MKRKTVKSTIDTGTPPASKRKQDKIKETILSGEILPPEPEVEEVTTDAQPEVLAVDSSSPHERVRLEHELYELTFRALDVSISKHQIAIKIPQSSVFKFEPKVDSKFIISHMGASYDAVYLGGIFTFPSDNTWAITFILNKKLEKGEVEQ